MDFGSYTNWRSAPRQTTRHQQTRNYNTLISSKATGDRDSFGEILSKSPDIYAGAAVASLNQMFYSQRTIVSNKKFNTPFESSHPEDMQIVKSKDVNKNTSRSNKITNSFMRNSRVDFYPVFVGMTNFFTGIVNNFTGAGKEETAIDASASINVSESPPIVHNMCDLVRTVDSDISGSGAKNTAGENRTAATDTGSSRGTAEAAVAMDADRSPAAAARGCQAKVDSIKELLNKSKTLTPKPTVKVTAFEESADVVDCGPVTNASVISSCEDKLQKLKQTIFSLKKTKINARSPTPELPKFSQNSLKPLKFTPKEDQIPPETICKGQCKSGAMLIPGNRRNKTRSRAERSRKQMKLDIREDLALKRETECGSLSSSSEAPRKPVPKLEPKPRKSILKNSFIPMAVTPSSESDCEFNEVKGRFQGSRSSECESDDSFIIIFQDPNEPESSRQRIPSECESEDSFVICFEPEPCFTNEVFIESDSDHSDSESENDHVVTHTIDDLTDCLSRHSVSNGSVQSASRPSDICDIAETAMTSSVEKPDKKVRFASEPPLVHVMRTWSFARRAARVGPWERAANDRERFKRRIADVDLALSWVLKPQHRARVLFQRIMPWRHAQRRLELAEIKRKKEEEETNRKINEEESRKKEEEETIRKVNEEEECIQREKEDVERIQKGVIFQANQEDLHCNGNAELDSEESTLTGDVLNSCDNRVASSDVDNTFNIINHRIISEKSDSKFNNITDVPFKNYCDSNVNFNTINKNSVPLTKYEDFSIVNPKITPILNGHDDSKNESEHDSKIINVSVNKTPEMNKNSFININSNHSNLDLNGVGSGKSLVENLTKLNDALISADSAITELDRLAQQTIKYIDINVSKAVGELTNCCNGTSGSFSQAPLHDKSDGGSKIPSKSDLIANITMIR